MADADNEVNISVDFVELDVTEVGEIGGVTFGGRDVGTARQQFSDEGFFDVGDV